eukprot:gnl/TRDRNA2_/TRDRNA2_159759_c0_seq3.p1 gnl/TRDRNA2_/TRDRNA2_159759_c0~~gnl/TRDRNA2_/TRDRNA2_159759_c0_seq3.p1  ORF type:complete len:517 (+),score=60.92 gnl/TRDRNA2_/TRDRNA2_159759_c0_seq3:105-1553(+)
MRLALLPLDRTRLHQSMSPVAMHRIHLEHHLKKMEAECFAASLPLDTASVDECWTKDHGQCCRLYLSKRGLMLHGGPTWINSEASLGGELEHKAPRCWGDAIPLGCHWDGVAANGEPAQALAFASAWLALAIRCLPDDFLSVYCTPGAAMLPPFSFDETCTHGPTRASLLFSAAEVCLSEALATTRGAELALRTVHPLWLLLDRFMLPKIVPVMDEAWQFPILVAVLPDCDEVSMHLLSKREVHCPTPVRLLLRHIVEGALPGRGMRFVEVGGFIGDCALWAVYDRSFHVLEIEPHAQATAALQTSLALLRSLEGERRVTVRTHALGDEAGWFGFGSGSCVSCDISPARKLSAVDFGARTVRVGRERCVPDTAGCVEFHRLDEELDMWFGMPDALDSNAAVVDVLRIKANGFEPAILHGLGAWASRVRWVFVDCYLYMIDACNSALTQHFLVIEDSWWSGHGDDWYILARSQDEKSLESSLH